MEQNGAASVDWDEQETARAVFGDRYEIAERYYQSLATDGVERGSLVPVKSLDCGSVTFSIAPSSVS